IFKFIEEKGNVPEEEMFRTFNMGIGFIVVVSEEEKERAIELLTSKGERVFDIGKVVKGGREVVLK
ncbi:MAG: AIR synthase-related protein, partial [Desulfurobacteriaceae bacterium]